MPTIKTNVLPTNLRNLVAKTGLNARTVKFTWTDAAYVAYNTGSYGADRVVHEDNCLKTVDPTSAGYFMDDGGESQNETITEFHGPIAYRTCPTGGKPYVVLTVPGIKAGSLNEALKALGVDTTTTLATSPLTSAPKSANPAVMVALDTFLPMLEAKNKEWATKWEKQTPDALRYEYGKKFLKIVKGSSAYCFIDLTNGDVLKVASFNAPAKHARGNILAGDWSKMGLGEYGAAYLR